MSDAGQKSASDFVLPPSVVTRKDVSHLVNELEQLDNALTTQAVRSKVGSTDATQLEIPERLKSFLQQNQVTSLSDSHARSELIKQLRQLKDKVPVLHMTFAVEADLESLGQLVQWLRTSVHPQAVIEVGLQPALVAGVYLRTPNHVHDFSLRGLIEKGHGLLIEELETLRASR